VSKRARERDVSSGFDSDFQRALEESEYRSRDRGRRIEQKTQQLCRQVQRALNLALAGLFTGGVLDDVFVVAVSTVAGCGRLLAHVVIPSDQSAGIVLAELRDRAPRLRAIVAGYISRKRAPELSFVVVPPGSGCHD